MHGVEIRDAIRRSMAQNRRHDRDTVCGAGLCVRGRDALERQVRDLVHAGRDRQTKVRRGAHVRRHREIGGMRLLDDVRNELGIQAALAFERSIVLAASMLFRSLQIDLHEVRSRFEDVRPYGVEIHRGRDGNPSLWKTCVVGLSRGGVSPRRMRFVDLRRMPGRRGESAPGIDGANRGRVSLRDGMPAAGHPAPSGIGILREENPRAHEPRDVHRRIRRVRQRVRVGVGQRRHDPKAGQVDDRIRRRRPFTTEHAVLSKHSAGNEALAIEPGTAVEADGLRRCLGDRRRQ